MENFSDMQVRNAAAASSLTTREMAPTHLQDTLAGGGNAVAGFLDAQHNNHSNDSNDSAVHYA